MSTLNSIPKYRISKQFLLKVSLRSNKLILKTKGFGGSYFQDKDDQNTIRESKNTNLEEQQQVNAKGLVKGKKDKQQYQNDQERVFVGEFTYETIPSQCRVWFNNINDVYETLIDEGATEIFRTLEGLQVRLRIVIEKNQKSFVRINKFVLHVSLSEQKWEEELVKVQAFESESSELSPNDLLQKNLLEIKSPSPNSNQNKETLKNIKKTVIGLEQKSQDERENTLNEIQKGTQKQMKELKRQLGECFSLIDETKNNTGSLRQFVQSFMSRMQVRWESVTKELEDVRSKNYHLERNYEKFKEMVKIGYAQQLKSDEKMKEIKVDYKFSHKNKHQDIQIINNNTIKCFPQDSTFKIILLQPTTFLTKRNPFNNSFQLNIKINSIKSYIAVGVCEKQIVKALKFQQFQTDIKGHGCYLLDWNGECWSNYRPETKSKPNKALKFKQNDVISLVFQSNKKMLRVTKLGKEEEGKNFVNMLIDPIVPLNELCFCVYLSGNGDEVEIMGRQPPAIIDLELQQPSFEERS